MDSPQIKWPHMQPRHLLYLDRYRTTYLNYLLWRCYSDAERGRVQQAGGEESPPDQQAVLHRSGNYPMLALNCVSP